MAEYAYRGDAQFLAWGDGPQGPWIKLKLPDSDDLAPFRGMTQAKATQAGQILAIGIIEVRDGDQPSAETDAKIIEAAKGGAKARLAGILCADPTFQKWLFDRMGAVILSPSVDREASAAAMIRELCRVRSRAELDHNEAAGKTFDAEIRLPWQEHCAK